MNKVTRYVLILISMIVLSSVISCSKTSVRSTEETISATLTSNWTFYCLEGGETIIYADDDYLDEYPGFSCTDGKTITFSTGSETYTGTVIEKEDGSYEFDLGGKHHNILGTIEGDTLTIKLEGIEKTKFVFKAVE